MSYESADDFKFIGKTAKYNEKRGYYVGIVKQNGKYGIINQHNEVLLDFMFDDIIFYHNYEQFGYYEPTYLCMYKGKKYTEGDYIQVSGGGVVNDISTFKKEHNLDECFGLEVLGVSQTLCNCL